MKRSSAYYKMLKEVDQILSGMPYEAWEPLILKLLTIRRLAKKHHHLAEMECNGEGWIRGQRYYSGSIDEWAKSQYGSSIQSAYVADEEDSIFSVEQGKVEAKITDLVNQLGTGWRVEFQGDPRGNTVKLYCGTSWINLS